MHSVHGPIKTVKQAYIGYIAELVPSAIYLPNLHTKINIKAQVEYYSNKQKYEKYGVGDGTLPYITLENGQVTEPFSRNRNKCKAIEITCPIKFEDLVRELLHKTSLHHNWILVDRAMGDDKSNREMLKAAYQLQNNHVKNSKVVQLVNIEEQEFEDIRNDLEKIDSVLYHDHHFLTSTYGRWNVVVKMGISDEELQEIDRILSTISTSKPQQFQREPL